MTWPYLGKESQDPLPQEDGFLVPRSPCGLVTVQAQQGDLWAQRRDRHQQAGDTQPLSSGVALAQAADGAFGPLSRALLCC